MRFTVTESVASGPPPLVLQTMVKVDWEVMVAVYGEFREKLLLLSAFPLASLVPEGSVTSQEVTLLPLQEMVEVVPERTRPGREEVLVQSFFLFARKGRYREGARIRIRFQNRRMWKRKASSVRRPREGPL